MAKQILNSIFHMDSIFLIEMMSLDSVSYLAILTIVLKLIQKSLKIKKIVRMHMTYAFVNIIPKMFCFDVFVKIVN